MADCTQAAGLTEGFAAEALLADKAYDTDAIVADAQSRAMEPVIPPKKNRKGPRAYDDHLYRLRHLVENAFLRLKGWRVPARIVWTRFCNSGRLLHGISLTGFEG